MAMMMKRFLCVLPLCKMWWRQLGEELGQDLGIVSRWLWWPWVEGGVLLFVLWNGMRRQRSIMIWSLREAKPNPNLASCNRSARSCEAKSVDRFGFVLFVVLALSNDPQSNPD